MKKSGCNSISYGFESFSPIVLKSMHKPISPNEIDYAFKQTIKVGITVQANFIFGDPAETTETYMETLRYWRKNCCGQIHLNLVTPYPGSEIYNYCVRNHLITDKKDYIENKLGTSMNMTAMTEAETITMYRDILLHKFLYHKHFIIFHRKPPFFLFHCPYCHHSLSSKNMVEIRSSVFVYTCRYCSKQFYIVYFLRYFRILLTLLKAVLLRNSSYWHLKN